MAPRSWRETRGGGEDQPPAFDSKAAYTLTMIVSAHVGCYWRATPGTLGLRRFEAFPSRLSFHLTNSNSGYYFSVAIRIV